MSSPPPTPPDRSAPQERSTAASAPTAGWCAREVEQELPGLRLISAQVDVTRRGSLTGDSPQDVTERLREMSNGFRGATAVGVRREPVASAYRVFFRQIGMDPEVVRTPIEAAVLKRMMKGGFLSAGLLADVLLIGLVDTGVPVWALDAERVDGPLGIRTTAEGEPFGRAKGAPAQPAGRLVVADASAPLAILFGELASDAAPTGRSRRLALFAVQVPGVPELYIEEAMWICGSSLQTG
jgi:DNA/RNA-binding domain of Phe-tRNA-synthetase-like protein